MINIGLFRVLGVGGLRKRMTNYIPGEVPTRRSTKY